MKNQVFFCKRQQSWDIYYRLISRKFQFWSRDGENR